jgi:hypothetical protein
MNVELAEERILLLADRFSIESAEARALTKRTEAFGALAKLGGLISKPKDEDYEIVYRERRLQPFWRLSAQTAYTYERRRDHKIKVGHEVQSVALFENSVLATNKEVTFSIIETCKENNRREWFFDGLTKASAPNLKSYLQYDAAPIGVDALNDQTKTGAVVVPPQAKSSALTRDVLSQVMPKIEADKILEEKVQIDAIDLYYRPVYAFRYRWQGKEAVVEFDAVTGEVRTGGATFETYVGKYIDPVFLLDIGAEAANMFIPGVNLAKIMVVKGLKLGAKA